MFIIFYLNITRIADVLGVTLWISVIIGAINLVLPQIVALFVYLVLSSEKQPVFVYDGGNISSGVGCTYKGGEWFAKKVFHQRGLSEPGDRVPVPANEYFLSNQPKRRLRSSIFMTRKGSRQKNPDI